MFDDRLPTGLWVKALVRRALLGGAGAFVLHAGDESRGDVVVKIADLRGGAKVFVPRTGLDGVRRFVDLAGRGAGPDEASADDYICRARDRDTDLWVIEIEDPKGRHFLTEPVESIS